MARQPEQHPQRGGLTGAVRPEKTDDLTLLDLEINLLDRLYILIFAFEKTTDCRAKPAFALRHLISLA
jgi:hypothetical protein